MGGVRCTLFFFFKKKKRPDVWEPAAEGLPEESLLQPITAQRRQALLFPGTPLPRGSQATSRPSASL